MENLSLNDMPGPLPGGGGPTPQSLGAGQQQQQQQHPPSTMQPQPQLPPQMFTTAAQLLDLTDKKLMVSLRDGRKLIGVLRSWDQFANLVLQSTVERIFVTHTSPPLFADVPRGVFLVRGENVLLLGEIDLDRDDAAPAGGFERAPAERVHELARRAAGERKGREKQRLRRLNELGFEGENVGEMLL